MFREMRRKDRRIDDKEAAAILEAGQYGVLSICGSNGYAYGVPLSYVYKEGSIYFHSATEGQKLDEINYNNKVSFCVVGKTTPLPKDFAVNYESVIAFGRAKELFDTEKQAALEDIIAKYAADYTAEGLVYIRKAFAATKIIKIEIDHITGKSRR